MDPALYNETFDSYRGILFKSLQGTPLDIRYHRPSFVMLSEHAMAAAVFAEKMGWDQGAHANILESSLDHGRFEISPTKAHVERIKSMLRKTAEKGRPPGQAAESP